MLKDLAYYSGTDNYYKHSLNIVYTDGVKYVAEETGAYWLIDAIASYETQKFRQSEQFQVWRLLPTHTDKCPNKAVLICEDGNDGELKRQTIPFTDFPFDALPGPTFYFTNDVLMLPSEY
jgi:hypothetical protein